MAAGRPAERMALFARLLPPDPRVQQRYMSGCPCAFANGTMFMGVHQDSLFLRLGETDRVEIVATYGAVPFDPMGGRPMREYVVLPEQLCRDEVALAEWIGRGFAYALTVPPRPRRAGRRRNP